MEVILAHAIKGMFISLEMHVLKVDGEEWAEEEEVGWSDAHCQELARAFFIHESKLAAEALGINTVVGIWDGMRKIQLICDKRKTKA